MAIVPAWAAWDNIVLALFLSPSWGIGLLSCLEFTHFCFSSLETSVQSASLTPSPLLPGRRLPSCSAACAYPSRAIRCGPRQTTAGPWRKTAAPSKWLPAHLTPGTHRDTQQPHGPGRPRPKSLGWWGSWPDLSPFCVHTGDLPDTRAQSRGQPFSEFFSEGPSPCTSQMAPPQAFLFPLATWVTSSAGFIPSADRHEQAASSQKQALR